MATYKCISCGELKESEKECNCPVCGYKMFETPYERTDILKKEIVGFISLLRLNEIPEVFFQIYRRIPKKNKAEEQEYEIVYKKDDDYKRFPEFKKIQGFVCSSSKTEEFRDNLVYSATEIRKHIHTSYSQSYKVNIDTVKNRIES